MTKAAAFTFPRSLRLLRGAEYRAVYRRGGWAGAGPLRARVRTNGLGCGRLGMAIAVRAAGGAVPRNHMRRQIRESFRLNQHWLAGLDIVVSVPPPRRGQALQGCLRGDLPRLWDRVARAARKHSKWNG